MSASVLMISCCLKSDSPTPLSSESSPFLAPLRSASPLDGVTLCADEAADDGSSPGWWHAFSALDFARRSRRRSVILCSRAFLESSVGGKNDRFWREEKERVLIREFG